ncbi:MAG: threonine synthase, partial [Burkholderiaceae bacterium]
MNYISTRGGASGSNHGSPARFLDILLEGLAPDGGLTMPERYPQIDRETLDVWRYLSYPELA